MAITVNGTEYASWDDVPDDLKATLRSALPDANHDGVPDLFQGALPTESQVHTSMKIEIGDQVYDSLDEVPEPMRSALRRAGVTGPLAPGQVDHQPPPPIVAMPPSPPADAGPVLLNGVPVDATGRPRKRHWWHRRA